ncbi:polysaccharide deacetylase family protein [Fulvivirgaceae bacterium BMA10]|uniref:Polysaccharide deacetylase family protein n=1 Tax=Splendidivirga corallicola TaxID=3051826 RepID=A0ABT8KX91_9BACT|nr:polysaccharide deacetylase family protein [Fulvivirgaceae bacterium BMA10]
MKITSLLYHDVVTEGNFEESGFMGNGPNSYKLDETSFCDHLSKAAGNLKGQGEFFKTFLRNGQVESHDIQLITFDDGGVSFITRIAPLLEKELIQGVFFISTKFIGQKGFLNGDQIRSLAERGHIIGSHSHSHPERISALTYQQVLNEWKESKVILEEILGEEVNTASIPGGFFSNEVARSAQEAGYKVLFTSEPTNTCYYIGDCMITGRYSIKRGDSGNKAEQIVKGSAIFRIKQFLFWNLKKVVKKVLGDSYLSLRKKLIK